MTLLRQRLEELGVGYVPVLIKKQYDKKTNKLKKEVASFDDISENFIRFHQYLRRPRYNYKPRKNEVLPNNMRTDDYAWLLNKAALTQYIKHKETNDNLMEEHRRDWVAMHAPDELYPYQLVMAMDCRRFHIVDVDSPEVRNHPEIKRLLTSTWYFTSEWRQLEKLVFMIDGIDIDLFKANPQVIPKCEMQFLCWSYFGYDTVLHNTHLPIHIYSSLPIFLIAFPEAQSALKSSSSPNTPTQPRLKNEDDDIDITEEIDTTDFEPNSIFIKNAFDTLHKLQPTYFNEYNNWFVGVCICKNSFTENKREGLKMAHYFSKLTNEYDPEEVNDKWVNIHKHDYDGQEATVSTLDHLIQELSCEKTSTRLLAPRTVIKHDDDRPHSPKTEDTATTTDADEPSSTKSPCDSSETTISNSYQHPDIDEIERILPHFPQHLWESPSFKEEFIKIMKCVDDRDVNYDRCKFLISHYNDHPLDDKEAYQFRKFWEKIKPNKKFNLKYIQQRFEMENPVEYEKIYKIEKGNYTLLKFQFEKTHFKLENPVRYICILPDKTAQYLTESSLETKYRHMKCLKYSEAEKRVVCVSFIDCWENDPQIRRVYGIRFNPRIDKPFYHEDGCLYYNLFSGLRASNLVKEGIIEDTTYLSQSLDFIRERLCGGNVEFFDYFIRWLAHIVQRPWDKTKVMPIFMSPAEGTGKSMFFNWFGKVVLGRQYYYSTAKTQHIVGRFNSMMEGRLLVVFNEVRRQDTKDDVSTLKDIIDAPTITIEQKGLTSYEADNFCNFASTTNNEVPYIINDKDRRYTGIESKVEKLETADAKFYGDTIFNFLEPNDGFIVAFYNYLMQMDLRAFCPCSSRVMTEFIQESVEIMTHHIVHFLFWYVYMAMSCGHPEFKEYDFGNLEGIQAFKLHEVYEKWFSRYRGRHGEPMSSTSFGRKMKKIEGVSHKLKKFVIYSFDKQKLDDLFRLHQLLGEEHTPLLENNSAIIENGSMMDYDLKCKDDDAKHHPLDEL